MYYKNNQIDYMNEIDNVIELLISILGLLKLWLLITKLHII